MTFLSYFKKTSTKILAVTIVAEFLIILCGITLAITMGLQAYQTHNQLYLALSAMFFPLMLAVLEVFKIPSGISLFKTAWYIKPAAFALLMAGSIATFETVTSAGLTWFKHLQHQITSEQTNLARLEDNLLVLDEGYNLLIQEAPVVEQSYSNTNIIEELREEINTINALISNVGETPEIKMERQVLEDIRGELLKLENSRRDYQNWITDQYDTTQKHLQDRMKNGTSEDATEAARAQKSLPSRHNYIISEMSKWDENNLDQIEIKKQDLLEKERGVVERLNLLIVDIEKERKDLISTREALNDDLNSYIRLEMESKKEDRETIVSERNKRKQESLDYRVEREGLEKSIQESKERVDVLSSKSLIYDIAAKFYSFTSKNPEEKIKTSEITEEQANTITAWVVGMTAFAVALSTGLSAFVATAIDSDNRRDTRKSMTNTAALLRRIAVAKRWHKSRVKTVITKPDEKIRVVEKIVEVPVEIQRNTVDSGIRKTKEYKVMPSIEAVRAYLEKKD